MCCKIKSEQGGERAGQPEVNFCNPCYSSICSFGCSAFVKKHYYLYKKIKKIKVRKTQKIYVRGVEKKSRSTVQLKTYSIKYFRGCFAFVYKSKSRATVKNPVYLYLITTLIYPYFTPQMFISNPTYSPIISQLLPLYTPSLTRYDDLLTPHSSSILNLLTNP